MLCSNCGTTVEGGKARLCPRCDAARNGSSVASTNATDSASVASFGTARASEDLIVSAGVNSAGAVQPEPILTIAPRFHRLVAAFIDRTILALPVAAFGMIIEAQLLGMVAGTIKEAGPNASSGTIMSALLGPTLILFILGGLALMILYPLYGALLEGSVLQATLGKWIVGIKVVAEDGTQASLSRAATRQLGKWVCYLPILLFALFVIVMVGSGGANSPGGSPFQFVAVALLTASASLYLQWKTYGAILTDPNGRGLHDKIARCIVVSTERPVALPVAIVALIIALAAHMGIELLMEKRAEKVASSSTLTGINRVRITTGPAHEPTHAVAVPETKLTHELTTATPPEIIPVPTAAVANKITKTASTSAESNLVTFGTVKRFFPSSIGFLNQSRTKLRLYLGQGDLSESHISRLARHELDGLAIPPGAELLFLAEFTKPIDQDCSFSNASRLNLLLYRGGIVGFPLPGSNNTLPVQVDRAELAASSLSCTPLSNGAVRVTGQLTGKGKYSQGQAVWPVYWNLKLQ